MDLLSDVLVLRDSRGFAFLPRARAALVRPEHHGRLEVTGSRGEVLHRDGRLADLEGAPLARAVGVLSGGTSPGPGRTEVLVHPALVGATGWRLEAEAPLPPPTPNPPDPEVPGIGVRRSEVLHLTARSGKWTWTTDRGPIPARQRRGTVAARTHGGLVYAGKWTWVNPHRLRALHKATLPTTAGGFEAVFDDGSALLMTRKSGLALVGSLGLRADEPSPSANSLQELLFREGLQDWPEDLLQASPEVLRAHFGGQERRLVASVLWSVVVRRRQGEATDLGRSHRGFWYVPLVLLLARAGLLDLTRAEVRRLEAGDWAALAFRDPGRRAMYRRYLGVLADLVRAGLFTFEELGFEPPRPDLRWVGHLHPRIVLLVEKDSLSHVARRLHQEYGVTVVFTGGVPKLSVTEALVGELEDLLEGPLRVRIVALCDWDPVGHSIPEVQALQFGRHGVEVLDIGRLVTPDRFTSRELEELAVPISTDGPGGETQLREWVAATGGVLGRPLGLLSNHLSEERIEAAFRQLTGV